MSQATLETILSTPPDEIPEIAVTALSALGYSRININSKFRQATAREDDSAQHGMERFDYSFNVTISWDPSPPGVKVTVKVSERNYNFQNKSCKERCKQLIEEIQRFAEGCIKQSTQLRNTWGSAKFATIEDLCKQGYLEPMTSQRFLIGWYQDQIVSLPPKFTHEHVMICGPTGCGKSSTMFIPNLIKRTQTSALITEAASGKAPPVLYQKTARWREKAGHKILYFNPADRCSTRINPLDGVASFDDASDMSHLIIRNTQLPWKASSEQIWEQSEMNLLNSLILYTVGLRKGPKAEAGDNANLGHIRSMLRAGPDDIGELIMNSPIELARLEYGSFVKNTSPNFRYGVVSGLLSRLTPWVNKKVAALTEVTDFDPETLKRELFSFYFVSSTKKPQLRSVSALAFNFVFDLVQDPDLKHPMTLLLDELANFGYIPELPDKLTHIRNQGIGVVLGIQNPIQLSRVYTDKDATLLLTQAGTRIYFRPRDGESAQRISRSLGNATIVIRKVASSGGIHEDERQRPLMDASEVERLPKGKAIVLTPSTDPLLIDTFPPASLDEFTAEPPSPRPEVVADDTLVRMCEEAQQAPPWQDLADQQIKKAANPPKDPRNQRDQSNKYVNNKPYSNPTTRRAQPSTWNNDCQPGGGTW